MNGTHSVRLTSSGSHHSVELDGQDVEYRDCPSCGAPVMQGQTLWRAIKLLFRPAARVEPCPGVPVGPGWLEYTDTRPRVWMVHSAARCAYIARHGLMPRNTL